MKLLVISDIHGELRYINSASHLIMTSDAVLIAGDISDSGSLREAVTVINEIERFNRNIIAVHGNWDGAEVIDFLTEKGYGIHGDGRIVSGVGFFGTGGSEQTFINSPSEYTRAQLKTALEKGYGKVRNAGKTVLLSHTPPKNVRDRTHFLTHAGSVIIRNFILSHKIDLCVCGHIHEASGIEALDNCQVLNPGPFQNGRYGIVDIAGTITLKTGKFR